MSLKLLRKQSASQTASVVVFVASLLFAQLATLQHDADHASHQDTHLCDAFTAYGHGNTLLAATGFPDFYTGHLAVSYVLTVSLPQPAEPDNTRIRDPPSLSV